MKPWYNHPPEQGLPLLRQALRRAASRPARVLAAILAGLALTVSALPAEAAWEWGREQPTSTQVPAAAQTAGNGYAMGAPPNYWTICVANGYGPTATGLIDNWNWAGFRLAVSVRNRCDGYSATNRLTIDSVNQAGQSCIFYTRTHTTRLAHPGYTGGRYYNVFDDNVVVWINTTPACFEDNIQLYHHIQKGVGYVLGLAYNPIDCLCIMGSTYADTHNVPYVTFGDAQDANQIYRP